MASIKLLLLNPNSSSSMTDGMLRAISSMPSSAVLSITPYTAPAPSPASINDSNDILASHDAVIDDQSITRDGPFDGILVACYSQHSLVNTLARRNPDMAVTGIFEASTLAVLGLGVERWGIVTTGAFWEEHLRSAVGLFLNGNGDGHHHHLTGMGNKFAGVYSTGLDAQDFHSGAFTESDIREKLRKATRALLLAGGRVGAVVLGCAGMAGLEEMVREAATDAYGQDEGRRVFVVDPVRAGVVQLEAAVKNRRMFGLGGGGGVMI